MFLLIFGIAFVAALLSSMSGAGAAMLTTPAWLILGYPLPVAIASNQVNGAAWVLVAARHYLHGRQVDWRLVGGIVAFGLVGAWLGTRVIVSVDSATLERVIGAIILSLVVFMLLRRGFGLHTAPPALGRLPTSALGVPLGFYEGFFGSGNGIFTSAVLAKTRGFDLLTALGYYYIIAFAWDCFAASIYIGEGHGSLSLMLPSTLGSLAGAWIGSRIGRRRGAGFVRALFIALGGMLGLKLVFGL